MSSRWGRQFQISIFGESHGAGIGVVIDGVPAGFTLDLEELYAFLKRRAPGRNRASPASGIRPAGTCFGRAGWTDNRRTAHRIDPQQ